MSTTLRTTVSCRTPAFQVGLGLRIDPGPGDRDHVEGAVELSVSAAVQAMAIDSP
jgi:hypothetical protein